MKTTMTAYDEAVKRDDARCRVCGRLDYAVHHIKFRSMGGDNSVDNLVCLCNECHDDVHAHKIALHVTYNPFDIFVERLR